MQWKRSVTVGAVDNAWEGLACSHSDPECIVYGEAHCSRLKTMSGATHLLPFRFMPIPHPVKLHKRCNPI